MKRKLFCLLTLLLAVCSGAWAESFELNSDVTTTNPTFPVVAATTAYSSYNTSQKLISIPKGGTFQFKNVNGYEITSITVEGVAHNNSAQTKTVTVSDGTNTYSTGAVSWHARTSGTTGDLSSNAVTSASSLLHAANQVYTVSADYALGIRLVINYSTSGGGGGGAANAPVTPNFTPDGGSVNGVSTVTVASTDASKIYYYWSDESTPAAVGNAAYTEASGNSVSVTVPNETNAAKYLHAYGWNDYNEGSTSSIYSKSFNITAVSGKSTWDLSTITADDVKENSFWTETSTTEYTNTSAIDKNTDTTIPNSVGNDLLNGIKIGATSAISANKLHLFINYSGVYGLRSEQSSTYFKIPVSKGSYYRITHTAHMNDASNSVGFVIDGSSATLISGELTKKFTDVASDPNVFILRADASTIKLSYGGDKKGRAVLTKIEEMDILSASWKRSEETVTSDSFYEGDTAPTAPTLNVTSSKGTSLTGDEYSVAYETSDADIVAVNPSTGITEIKNTKTGTATVTATLTTSTEGFMVVTNTYTYTVTVNAKVPTYVLDKADNEISLRSTPLHRSAEPAVSETATVTMSADFLAGTSGTVAFTTDVDGLSVSPAAFTIIDGSVAETEFTITYNSASGASGTATLRFSDGTNNKDLIIEYASVVPHEWATVSETTTWDWTQLTSEDTRLTDSTTPTKTDEFLMGDMTGEILTQDIYKSADHSVFNADALKIITEYVTRHQSSDYFMQGNSIRFKTSVPGTVQVWFSNTGNRGDDTEANKESRRYLLINGANTGVYSLNVTHIEASKVVPAGEVLITAEMGVTSPTATMVRVSKIIFTADDEIGQKSIEITCEGGLASYSCTTDGLDFSTSNVKAYIVTAKSSSYATLTEVTKAPANTGLIIMGTKGQTYNVLTTNEATSEDVEGNLLEATGVSGTAVEKDAAYVLSKTDGKFHLTNAGTIPAGKAYLPAGAVGARILELSFGDEEGETTSLREIRNEELGIKNAEFFNLNGQRVAQPTKGLYIVNGRKVVIK